MEKKTRNSMCAIFVQFDYFSFFVISFVNECVSNKESRVSTSFDKCDV